MDRCDSLLRAETVRRSLAVPQYPIAPSMIGLRFMALAFGQRRLQFTARRAKATVVLASLDGLVAAQFITLQALRNKRIEVAGTFQIEDGCVPLS